MENLIQPEVLSKTFENAKIDDISVLTEFVESELEKLDCPMKTVIQINVAIDELFSNIVLYAYGGASGSVTVNLIKNEEPRSVSLQFIDSGTPYDPLAKDDPDVTLNAEERSIGGLGIFMVKKTMDDMKYEYKDEKNILTITKNI